METSKFGSVGGPLDEDSFFVSVPVGIGFLGAASVIAPFCLSLSSTAALVAATTTFVLWRHYALSRPDAAKAGHSWMGRQEKAHPSIASLPAVYFLYVLGSGGHTTEMCETIKRKFLGQRNIHRRYVSTTGDKYSALALRELENLINDAYADGGAGTWDHFEVKRARAVHQPFYTAWLTSIWSALSIVNALSREPDNRPGAKYGHLYRYPHVIITNGPGTGFILCLVAHLLKIFYLVPQNRLKLVYIESWAHTQTLSLTGKLFHWTGIANLFCVQHRSLAEKFGKQHVGLVAERAAPMS